MKVYFCFKGDTTKSVADAHVAIDRDALEAAKESVLAKLASDMWASNEKAGSSETIPIITHPLKAPCKDEWDPVLAEMIADAYHYHEEMKKYNEAKEKEEGPPPSLKLPAGVEFQDALAVLDYYGLTIDESVNFDFSYTTDAIHIRALLFQKGIKMVQKAKESIIEAIKKDPKVVTLFLFTNSRHDMKHINKWNEKKFVRVGEPIDCENHLEWVENDVLRELLISSLDESGLQAQFVSENFYELYDGEPWRIYTDPKPGLSYVSVRRNYDNGFDDCELLPVLQVEVPRKAKKQRTV